MKFIKIIERMAIFCGVFLPCLIFLFYFIFPAAVLFHLKNRLKCFVALYEDSTNNFNEAK